MMQALADLLMNIDNQIIVFTHNKMFLDCFECSEDGHICKGINSACSSTRGKHIYLYETQSEGKNKKGVISIGSIQVSFIGATSFIIGLNEILQEKLQVNEKIIKEKNPMTSNLFFSSIDHTKKFLDFIYKDSTIYLDRKYERYLIFNKKYEEYFNKKLR